MPEFEIDTNEKKVNQTTVFSPLPCNYVPVLTNQKPPHCRVRFVEGELAEFLISLAPLQKRVRSGRLDFRRTLFDCLCCCYQCGCVTRYGLLLFFFSFLSLSLFFPPLLSFPVFVPQGRFLCLESVTCVYWLCMALA